MNIQQLQPIQHPTTFQQMSSQQWATITNTALINFFGNAWVLLALFCRQCNRTQQQTEQHTLGINIDDTHLIPTEHCQQLSHTLPVVVTDSEEEPGMFNSLDITQQNRYTNWATNITQTTIYIYIYIHIHCHKLNTDY